MTKLQKLRKDAGYTQTELAVSAGVSVRTLQYYEQGVLDIHKAAVETVFRISVALDCDVEDLLDVDAIYDRHYIDEA